MSEVLMSYPTTSEQELLERKKARERGTQEATVNPYLGEVMMLYLGLRNPFAIAAEATSIAMAPEQTVGQQLTTEELEELERQRTYQQAA